MAASRTVVICASPSGAIGVAYVVVDEIRFPGESEEYRAAREELLRAEIELRRHTERVAAQRRALPPGGAGSYRLLLRGGLNGR